MRPPDPGPSTDSLGRYFNWRSSFFIAVLGVIVGLLAAGAPAPLVMAAPLIGAVYALVFMTGTRLFEWLFSKLLFKDQ
jgi:hypothetical protein